MPSPLIHTATAWVLARPARSRASVPPPPRIPFLLYSIFAAMLPDADAALGLLVVPFSRLSSIHNQATHSLLFAIVAALLLSAAARLILFRRIPWPRLFAWTLLLLLSHLLLDWLTWGRGEPLLWPFTDRRYGSPVPLFYGVRYSEGLFSRSHWVTLLTETATVAAVWLLCLACRRGRRKTDRP